MNTIAKNILKLGCSSEDGVIIIIKQKEYVHIQSNGTNIQIDISNGRKRAEYDEAMKQLLDSDCITAINSEGTSYQITAKGFRQVQS